MLSGSRLLGGQEEDRQREDDLRRIDAVIEGVGAPERVAVDANGRFDLENAVGSVAE